QLTLNLARSQLPLGIPVSVLSGLIVVPVVYAALSFGLGGAGATAAWGILLMVPNLVLAPGAESRWVNGTLLLLAAAGAIAVGQRVDREVVARLRAAQAVQAHSAAEARYRALFEASSAPTLVVGADQLVREANPAAEELFGHDVSGRRLESLLDPAAARGLLDQVPPRMVSVADPQGVIRSLQPLSTLVTERGGEPLLQVILHDLTEDQERQRRTEAYASQLLRAQEEERRKVAQDLHDEPLQALIYLLRRLDFLTESEGLPGEVREHLEASRKVLATVIDELRHMAQGLRPSGLDDLGLGPALRQLTQEFSARSGVEAGLHLRGALSELDPELSTTVFRIVQEALNNVERHAEAHSAEVSVEVLPLSALVQVRDDGRGFDPKAATYGLGILGMEERAEFRGGRLEIRGGPGQGTTVTARLPRGGGAGPAAQSPRDGQPRS
ncbi:MAG: ATP-binding protein, partial [Candidatus Dormibacteria bacterium]